MGRAKFIDPWVDEQKAEMGYYIKSHRLHYGITLETFAKMFGVSTTQMYSYENGRGDWEKFCNVIEEIRRKKRAGQL